MLQSEDFLRAEKIVRVTETLDGDVRLVAFLDVDDVTVRTPQPGCVFAGTRLEVVLDDLDIVALTP